LRCLDTLFLNIINTIGIASSKGRVVSQENSGAEGEGVGVMGVVGDGLGEVMSKVCTFRMLEKFPPK
jgi:hypothetical protein